MAFDDDADWDERKKKKKSKLWSGGQSPEMSI
jgi:hypothetical protein